MRPRYALSRFEDVVVSRWPVVQAIPPHADGVGIASKGGGPCSNTGRTDCKEVRHAPRMTSDGLALSGALVDWLSFTVKPEGADLELLTQDPTSYARELCWRVFGVSALYVEEAEQRGKNGYTHTCKLINAATVAGFVAFGGNRGTVNVQLSGVGCAAVRCWYTAAWELQAMGAKLTRVDLAYDDYKAEHIDLHRWAAMAKAGEIHAAAGQTPKWREVNGSDSYTLYVGRKGNKELCVYEKGKEQGDPNSPWLRAELRVWAKEREIPYAVLTQTLSFIRGAYNVLRELPGHVCDRIKTTARKVAANAVACLAWLREAVGPSIDTLTRALGADRVAQLLNDDIRRPTVPRRFKGIPRDQLNLHLQGALCPF